MAYYINFTVKAGLILFLALFISSMSTVAQDEYVPNQLVVRLQDGVNLPDIEGELSQEGLTIVDSIEELNVYVLQVPAEELQNIQNSLSHNSGFQYVKKNHIVTANLVPTDSGLFNQQIPYFNAISAQQAWDTETGDPDVVIAILDTGVSAAHEDLNGKVLTGCSTLGGFNENSCGTNTNDVDGHGSGTAGSATAQTNNGIGVAGVCWSCQILPVKVLNDNGTGSDVDVTQGILFARNYALANPNKKVIINMSLGRNCQTFPMDPAMQDAINLAWNAGVLIVAAAGNDCSSELHCPASGANTIAVSATTFNDSLSQFSTHGNFVDLAAPGGDCSVSAGCACLVGLEGIQNVLGGTTDGYTGWIGTSFSSPIVAGVAGLVWSANMSLTNAQVDQILRSTADNIGSSFFFGDGRVNANAAVLAAQGPPPTVSPTPTPPPPSNPILTELDPGEPGGTSTLTVTGAPEGATVRFRYSLNTGITVISGGICNGQSLTLNNAINLGSATANGSGTASINIFVPQIADGLTVHLQAYAEGASQCGISNRVTQEISSTAPPVNLVLTPLSPGIAGGTSTLQVTGAPPGGTIIFKYSFNIGSSVITGGVCNGQNLSLGSANNVGMTTANGSGVATLNVPIPSSVSGVTVYLQAHTNTGASCGISNRVQQRLQ